MQTSSFRKTGILILLLLLTISFTACDMLGTGGDVTVDIDLETFSVTINVSGITPEDLEKLTIFLSGNDITASSVKPGKNHHGVHLTGLKGNVTIRPVLEGYSFKPSSIGVSGNRVFFPDAVQGWEVNWGDGKKTDHGKAYEFKASLLGDLVTGTLEQVFDNGNRVKMSGSIYTVAEDLKKFFENIDQDIYGSKFTVRINEGDIWQVIKIVLEDKAYDEIAFNSITEDNIPRARGLELVGTKGEGQAVTMVKSSEVSLLSDAKGTSISVGLDRIGISNIDFYAKYGVSVPASHATIVTNSLTVPSSYGVSICGDMNSISVEGDMTGNLSIDGSNVDFSVGGNMFGDTWIGSSTWVNSVSVGGNWQGSASIWGNNSTVSVGGNWQGSASISGNNSTVSVGGWWQGFSIYGDNTTVTAGGLIDGDVAIYGDNATCNLPNGLASLSLSPLAEDADITGDLTIAGKDTKITGDDITVGGDLFIFENDVDLQNIKEVKGDVLLEALANIDHLIFGANLIILVNEQVLELANEVPGNLSIRVNDVQVIGGTFGSIAESWGNWATLEGVTINTMYPNLGSNVDDDPLEEGGLFTINRPGWTFDGVNWPLDVFDIRISGNDVTVDNSLPQEVSDINITGANVVVANNSFSGDLILTGWGAGAVLDSIEVDGYLTINQNGGVTIVDSIIGTLANQNTAHNVTLENVEIERMYPNLNMYNYCLLEEGGTFVVDREGWTFDSVTWPLEKMDVEIDNPDIAFINNTFTGDVDIDGWLASITDSTIAGDLTINNTDATIEGTIISKDLIVNNRATIRDTKIEGETTVNGWMTLFEDVIFADDVQINTRTLFDTVTWPEGVDVIIANWNTLEFLDSVITNNGDLVFEGGNVTLRGVCNLVNPFELEIVPGGDETFTVTEKFFRQVTNAGGPVNLLDWWDGTALPGGANLQGYNYTLTDYDQDNPEWGDQFQINVEADGVRTISITENTPDNMSGEHELTIRNQVTELTAIVTVEITDTAQIETK